MNLIKLKKFIMKQLWKRMDKSIYDILQTYLLTVGNLSRPLNFMDYIKD